MPKFARWKYVLKKAELRNNIAVPVYKLGEKGLDFITNRTPRELLEAYTKDIISRGKKLGSIV